MARDTSPEGRRATEVHTAVRRLDRPRVSQLCTELVTHLRARPTPFPLAPAKRILGSLRSKRFFHEMLQVADALIQTGRDDPVVHRQHAQALIEEGALTAAEASLRVLVRTTKGTSEYGEMVGLLGRTLKQQYVNAPVPAPPALQAAFREAIRTYHDGYRAVGDPWHGINAVACTARAKHDGLRPRGVNVRALATEIRDRLAIPLVDDGVVRDYWHIATALEASVALGEFEAARKLARRYVACVKAKLAKDRADAFELASTLRQLQQVWQLGGTDAGRHVLTPIRRALLKAEAGFIELLPEEVIAGRPGDAYEGAGLRSIGWYATGLARARIVARIESEDGPGGTGTGFLMRGDDLAPRFRGLQLFMTNAHVVSESRDDRPRIAPSSARVVFEAHASDGAAIYPVRDVVWSSPASALDVTILALGRLVEGASDADCGGLAPRRTAGQRPNRVYIIGHPAGGALTYSLQDNVFVDYRSPWLHYRTPTTRGSSGSPLFDAQWRLLGIHHAGGREMRRLHGLGTYDANEGISIHAIRAALRKDARRPRA